MSVYAPLEAKARPPVARLKPLQRCADDPGSTGDRREAAGAPHARLQAALDGSPRVVAQTRRADALAAARALGVQPQLMIGAPDDAYEQEADRVARQVVSDINAPTTEADDEEDLVQREALEEDDELLAQRAPSISRAASGGAGGETEAPPELESSLDRARGGGESLPETLRARLEDSLGADLGGVRVHRDAHADQLNRQVQAKAFTSGQDVFFRKGLYNPGSRGGQELLAHELTHVVQQGGEAVRRRPQRRLARRADGAIQRVIYPTVNALLAAAVGPAAPVIANLDPEIQAFFGDAARQLPLTDVVANPLLNRAAVATPTPLLAHPYSLVYNPNTADQDYLVSSILHELIHVASARDFRTGGAVGVNPWLNLNLPPGLAGPALTAEINAQENVLDDNMTDLDDIIQNDATLTPVLRNHLALRVGYAQATGPSVHYDTVIADMMTYMELRGAANGPTWAFLKRMAAETNDRRLRDPWWGTQRARRVDANAAWYEVWKW